MKRGGPCQREDARSVKGKIQGGLDAGRDPEGRGKRMQEFLRNRQSGTMFS